MWLVGAEPSAPVSRSQTASPFTGSFGWSNTVSSPQGWLPSMFNTQQNRGKRKAVSIPIGNLSIPLCYILSRVSLLATQMLLFASCHCAVLFRGRTNRKPSLSSSRLPNSFEHWLLGPVSASTTGINFSSANPLAQIRWDAHAIFICRVQALRGAGWRHLWGAFFTRDDFLKLIRKILFETFWLGETVAA